MRDEDIDLSDIPETPAEMIARGVVRRGLKHIGPKTQLTISVDTDIADWYRKQGNGYENRINALLRDYMEDHLRQPTRSRARRA